METKDRKTTPWNMHLTLPTQPHCPTCGLPLNNNAVKIENGVAFCHRVECFIGELPAALALMISLNHPRTRHLEKYGIIWWTPNNPDNDQLTFARTRWLNAHPGYTHRTSLPSFNVPDRYSPQNA